MYTTLLIVLNYYWKCSYIIINWRLWSFAHFDKLAGFWSLFSAVDSMQSCLALCYIKLFDAAEKSWSWKKTGLHHWFSDMTHLCCGHLNRVIPLFLYCSVRIVSVLCCICLSSLNSSLHFFSTFWRAICKKSEKENIFRWQHLMPILVCSWQILSSYIH